jgi:putative endonuclease
MHFVYIVRCADGSLYTGYARDPSARIRAHNAGRGARYTSGRRPVRLVYVESFDTVTAALKREYELKQWDRARKQALIATATATVFANTPAAQRALRVAARGRSARRQSRRPAARRQAAPRPSRA